MKKTEIKNRGLPYSDFPWVLHVNGITQLLSISGVPPMKDKDKVVCHDDVIGQFQYEMERSKDTLTKAGMRLEDKVPLYGESGKVAEAYLR